MVCLNLFTTSLFGMDSLADTPHRLVDIEIVVAPGDLVKVEFLETLGRTDEWQIVFEG